MAIDEVVFSELEQVTGTDQVRRDPDIDLYGSGILDSLGTVELMVSLGKAFHITISPAAFEREQWCTPNKIIEYIQARVD